MISCRAQITPDSPEFSTKTPEIFDDIPWVKYGETRRTMSDIDPLSGCVAQADLPLDNTYDLLNPSIEREAFKQIQRERSAARIAALMSSLSLHELARPRPEYKTNLLDDSKFDTISHARDDRAFADAVHTQVEGRGIIFSPADCPLLVVADPTKNHQSLTVIHAGYKSLAENIIGKTLKSLPLRLPNVHAYVSPHALKDYPLYGAVLEQLEKSDVTREHLGDEYYIGENRNRNLDFIGAITSQLGSFGVKLSHIAASPDNSLTDPTLYSQRNWQQKGVNGRNAVMAGIN